MVFWSDENRPKIGDFWKKFLNLPVWPVVWAWKPKIVTHHYQLTLGNPPEKGLEVSWFLGLHIILPIQHISVKTSSKWYNNQNYLAWAGVNCMYAQVLCTHFSILCKVLNFHTSVGNKTLCAEMCILLII